MPIYVTFTRATLRCIGLVNEHGRRSLARPCAYQGASDPRHGGPNERLNAWVGTSRRNARVMGQLNGPNKVP